MIDKNRPQIRKMSPDGITVVEFCDQPGEYFDARGNELGEEHAAKAGYNVEAGRRAKRRRELEREAQERVEQQMREEYGQIDQKLDGEFARDGLRVEKRGRKYAVVEESTGIPLVDDLTKAEAEEAFEDLRSRGEDAKEDG